MKILFISDPYPSPAYPNNGVFVYSFVQELAKQGHDVTVLSPKKITLHSVFGKRTSYGSEAAKVHQPAIITASAKKIGPFNTYSLTHFQKKRAVKRFIKRTGANYDIIYCHFISTAMYAIEALKNAGLPIFVAVGENKNMETVKKWYNENVYFNRLNQVSGFVAVSEIIKEKLIERLSVPAAKILLAPNGTDLSLFKPKNKNNVRDRLGFPKESFIVNFVGRFIKNKGPLRVLKACSDLENVKLIFVGEGPQQFEHQNILFKNKVPRDQMPDLLAASDVFVLPTEHEGSNNAILEAMACGLPIVSSDIPEIKAQCTPEFSMLVDPMNIEAIRNAILEIKNNPMRAAEMSEKALSHSKNFDLSLRTQRIIGFIEETIQKPQ